LKKVAEHCRNEIVARFAVVLQNTVAIGSQLPVVQRYLELVELITTHNLICMFRKTNLLLSVNTWIQVVVTFLMQVKTAPSCRVYFTA